VSSKEKITRLEELLSRVTSRAAAPRVAAAGAPFDGASTTSAASATDTLQSASPTSVPPPTREGGYDSDDVEVSAEFVEVDIDVDMDEMAAMESGAQPVAEQASLPAEELHEAYAHASEPPLTPAMEPAVHAPPPANEIQEPAPSSSPRPIAEPLDEESAPRHTPPPESGKQVAASSSPPAPRLSSMPPSTPNPASLEGHTLIGGWREPGIFDPKLGPGGLRTSGGGVPGVRVPAPPVAPPALPVPPSSRPPARHDAPSAEAPPAPPAQGSAVRLSPEPTKAALPAGARVASFEGTVPTFKPKTFGELLDSTLDL
jgi:hypothetical protein